MSRDPSRTGIVFPSLAYDDAPAAIEFLCRAFGFEARLVVRGPADTIRHAELTFSSGAHRGVIFAGTTRADRNWRSPRRLGGASQSLSLHVADPDAHHARASAEGATILQPPRDEPYGARGYLAADPEGHEWYFSDYVPGEHWGADGGTNEVVEGGG